MEEGDGLWRMERVTATEFGKFEQLNKMLKGWGGGAWLQAQHLGGGYRRSSSADLTM